MCCSSITSQHLFHHQMFQLLSLRHFLDFWCLRDWNISEDWSCSPEHPENGKPDQPDPSESVCLFQISAILALKHFVLLQAVCVSTVCHWCCFNLSCCMALTDRRRNVSGATERGSADVVILRMFGSGTFCHFLCDTNELQSTFRWF